MNACLFPLDSHKCSMTFVAIGYNISILKLRAFPHPMSKNAKNSNGIWKLEASSVKEVSMPYHSKTKASLQLSVLTYNITASRKPEYYYTTLFVPIGFIFVMTFCAVLLPDDSGERVSLLITCFLAQIVFLDQVYKYLPKTSDYLPLAIQYLFALMFFTSLQIFITSITSSYASQAKKGKSMSSRSQTVFNVLGRVFCSKVKSKIQHKISFRNQSRKEDEVREIHLDGGNIMLVKRAFDGNDQSSENKDLPDRQEPTDRDKRSVTDKKECCRKAVKILDRISMTTSFIFMVLIPLYFALRFGKKVTSDCT